MHAFAGAGVAHGGFDAQFVCARGEAGEGQAVVDECLGVERLSVEGDGAQGGGLELDEGVPGRAGGEVDDGAGVEGVFATGEIEVDRVPVDFEELGSGLRFVARQYGHGDMLPDGVRVAQPVTVRRGPCRAPAFVVRPGGRPGRAGRLPGPAGSAR
ncbi:hypothetical protein GCM10010353_05900 [Streptomyces chryseus]|nr:hypothetical protein GCM10010353_05900 [Streptomyces chryseus]